MNQIYLFRDNPAGVLQLEANSRGLRSVSFINPSAYTTHGWLQHEPADHPAREHVLSAVDQLNEYFKGRLKKFDVQMDLSGLSAFTRLVLDHTIRINWGDVTTYGQLAASMGRPKSFRAVGGALGRNPIVIIIPCHRVLASSGHLHGYSAYGGLDTKALLLQIEEHRLEENRLA